MSDSVHNGWITGIVPTASRRWGRCATTLGIHPSLNSVDPTSESGPQRSRLVIGQVSPLVDDPFLTVGSQVILNLSQEFWF